MLAAGLLWLVGCMPPEAAFRETNTPRPRVTRPPASTMPASGGAETGWYRLYFTTPNETAALDNPSGGIPDRVIETMDAAQQSLDVAVYELDWKPLAEAMQRAQARGVRVRLVTDTETMGEETVQALQAAGIPVVDDRRDAIMHDKFAVIDGAAVWTGSMNFTRNDAYRNNNNFVYVRSVRLAQNYTREFEEMFVSREFGETSPADTPNPVVTIDGTRVENYFAPDDEVAGKILPVLRAAEHSIFFMAFAFTRADLANVLLERAADGVNVRGVFETRQIAAGATQAWDLLTLGGLAANVRQDGNRYNLHHKVFIIDEAIVITGSYNFSRNANERNDENVLIVHDPAVAASYLAEWERVWEEAGP
jgi:phosphatidylserine/phosphatidylglycerophosphate/cardiolipin synthase-like enzyme